MLIKACTYKGYTYNILFTDKGDWGIHQNQFHTKCEHNFDGGFAKSFEEVDNNIKKQIDNFLNNIPTTIDKLVSTIAEQLVWTGYENCHLDEVTTKELITAFINKQQGNSKTRR